LLLLFVLQELYLASSPVIPISVLSSRGVLLSSLTQLFFMTTRWCVLFYSPIYTLAVRDWDPATAGTILIPTNIGFALGGLVVGWLHIRRGGPYYVSTLLCLGIFPGTVIILSYLATPDSPTALYILVVFINGGLAGAALNYGLAHLLHITDPSTHFVATALLATARGFAGSFGAGIGGGLFARTLREGLESGFDEKGMHGPEVRKLIERLVGSPAIVGQLVGAEHEVAVNAYGLAVQVLFWVFSTLAVVGVVMQAGTGWSSWRERQESEGWMGKWRRWSRRWLGKDEEEG
jgi:Major Facilitator Superfamily